MMGSLQQSFWTNALKLPATSGSSYGFIPQVKFNNVMPCKASHAVSGKSSTLSIPVPEIGGNYLGFQLLFLTYIIRHDQLETFHLSLFIIFFLVVYTFIWMMGGCLRHLLP